VFLILPVTVLSRCGPGWCGCEGCGQFCRRRRDGCHGAVMTRLTRSDITDDRGDVPGWVLITLMTAGLVIVIWGLAGPALAAVFQQAIERVTGF